MKKENICKVETFFPRGELIRKEEYSKTYGTDRISIWKKANFFLKVDNSIFKLVEADLSSKLYITDVGFSSGNKEYYMDPNTYYHVQNSEKFPIQVTSNEAIQFAGLYAVRVEMNWFSRSRIVDRVAYIEDGIEVIRKINDPDLNEQFCGKEEITLENCSKHSMEQIKINLQPPYFIQ
ncbi:hypothetical protein EHQ12_09830 [Leptospira gomenensis]|uniref:Uncharacterized protein n=1 Tax=Leptospira gomenensis TaxID=2484974 RepID=A0A5F1YZN5_9LEPT|nr:hypothetical protein [Leptospira gomenensis]TGK33777.1 hypothetical protein EHQ17_10430 [Leptospira gomenensis]TGK38700.1 hypothetical protein EHQ12_09830 [Leptospira gomenensis]TGK40587.1 hypothetical protein EHQ07_18100 [Leptospira gomenensis]TGK65337.1 hypothetical protein EHQ13_05115 [Leptospira gomenensis]